MYTPALLLLGLGFVLAAALTALMKRSAPRVGLVDQPSERRVHVKPTPKGGGIAIFLGALLPVIAAYVCLGLGGRGPAGLGGVVEGAWGLGGIGGSDVLRHAETAILVFVGGAALVALGLADDLRGLPVWLRLGLEFLVAGALYFFTKDIEITFFAPYAWMPFLFTVFWIVGITNSFNLLDNMDGLSAGVALIVSGLLLWVALTTDPPQYFLCVLLLPFIGALIGFLLFNFPPASIFMGDAGSLFLGYFVAVLATICTFTSYPQGNIVAAAMPLLILAVPLYDTASVILIRWRRGYSIFRADKNHLSHRLVGLGLSQRDAVLTIYLLTFCCGVGAVLADQLTELGTALVLVQVFGFLQLTALLERAGAKAARKANGPLGRPEPSPETGDPQPGREDEERE